MSHQILLAVGGGGIKKTGGADTRGGGEGTLHNSFPII